MTARAADQVLSAQVNNSGVIQARTMAALKGGGGGGTVKLGKIKLLAHGGTTHVAGKLDASAPKGGNGGFIETSGDHVQVADNAVVTTLAPYGRTGTWLIDPTDFNIVAGNAAQTTSGIGASTLAGILASTNFAVTTFAGGTENGDINVDAAVSWSANNRRAGDSSVEGVPPSTSVELRFRRVRQDRAEGTWRQWTLWTSRRQHLWLAMKNLVVRIFAQPPCDVPP
jgi:hypothetical protein